ncbi:hypothetical protein C450_10313 [Halococcus salifodinae DSM 8989]|uniref:Uncharacterized protein n=1 Tax=Halococcus salifodinae DSM 8989 TaxID=1227456 RepID=M0N5U3_9EURY|nr:hypothetical protein C450_10313 [Halococcus salifodinae DSM 8989]
MWRIGLMICINYFRRCCQGDIAFFTLSKMVYFWYCYSRIVASRVMVRKEISCKIMQEQIHIFVRARIGGSFAEQPNSTMQISKPL